MVGWMAVALANGSDHVMVPNPREFEDIWKIFQHKATIFPGVPAMYTASIIIPECKAGGNMIYPLSRLASLALPHFLRETKDQFEKTDRRKKSLEGYGLSEAPTATHCNPLLGENKIGS